MADISNVDAAKIKDLYERLESLSCMVPNRVVFAKHTNIKSLSPNYDKDIILSSCLERTLRCVLNDQVVDSI